MDRPILFSAPMVRAILAGTKTQTRRVCKPAEAQGMTYVVNCMDGTWRNEEGDMPSFRCPHGVPGDRLWVRESHWWFKDEPASIHMPRWASRITLEVTGVRVERLQDISEADAIAEGIEQMPCEVPDTKLWRNYTPDNGWTPRVAMPQNSYRSLWESINGQGSWDANPWVWVVEFRRAAAELGRRG